MFARLGCLLGVTVVLAFAASDTATDPPLDPANAEDFVVRVDKLLDASGGGSCRGCVQNLDLLQAEILPWFVEEGIVTATAPAKAVWRFHADDQANHVLGQADCDGHVWMNARYVNPASPWYQRADALSTFVHELVHQQQGEACGGDREHVETTAVVVSLEILAAMANNGNRPAAIALLDELQGIVLSELRYRSLTDKPTLAFLDGFVKSHLDPWEQAERAQRWRYWNGPGRETRDFVFKAYAHDPYLLILKALRDGELEGLALAPVFSGYTYEAYVPTVDFSELRAFLGDAERLLGRT